MLATLLGAGCNDTLAAEPIGAAQASAVAETNRQPFLATSGTLTTPSPAMTQTKAETGTQRQHCKTVGPTADNGHRKCKKPGGAGQQCCDGCKEGKFCIDYVDVEFNISEYDSGRNYRYSGFSVPADVQKKRAKCGKTVRVVSGPKTHFFAKSCSFHADDSVFRIKIGGHTSPQKFEVCVPVEAVDATSTPNPEPGPSVTSAPALCSKKKKKKKPDSGGAPSKPICWKPSPKGCVCGHLWKCCGQKEICTCGPHGPKCHLP